MEARSYARSAPQLRNRLTLNDRGDVDGVEGTQQPAMQGGMQGAQMELEMDSPGGVGRIKWFGHPVTGGG